MNEERYAFRVRQVLNHGLKEIPPATARRLEAARHLALARQKQTAPALALAGVGTSAPLTLPHIPYLRQILSIAALLLGVWLSFYWHSTQYLSEIEAVDSALLADALPPEAFMDNEFLEWLKDDSSED